MKTIQEIILVGLLVTGFIYAIVYAIDKNEARECGIWQQQSEEYRDFEWQDWQIEMCNR